MTDTTQPNTRRVFIEKGVDYPAGSMEVSGENSDNPHQPTGYANVPFDWKPTPAEIATERARQIDLSYTPAYDDAQGREHLVREAANYMLQGRVLAAEALALALNEYDVRNPSTGTFRGNDDQADNPDEATRNLVDEDTAPAEHTHEHEHKEDDRPPLVVLVVGSYYWRNKNAVLEAIQTFWNEVGHPPLQVISDASLGGPQVLVKEIAEPVGFEHIQMTDEEVNRSLDNGDLNLHRVFAFIRDYSNGAQTFLNQLEQRNTLNIEVMREEPLIAPGADR